MRRYAFFSIGLAGLAAVVAPYDAQITAAVDMTRETGDLRRMLAMSEIFAHGFGVLVVALLVCFLAREKIRLLPRLLSCVLLTSFSISLIKHLVLRRRPQTFGNLPADISATWHTSIGHNADFAGWNSQFLFQSFPSGHAASAVALALWLCWVFPKGKYLFLTFAALGMLQRVSFLAHWPSDILFGAAIATMVAGNVFTAPLSDYTFGWIENSSRDRV